MMNDEFFQQATDVSRLAIRRETNERFGQVDLNQWVLGLVNIQKHERVLDVACGDGKQLMAYAQYLGSTGEVVGLDISLDALEVVEKQAARLRLPIRLVAGPMEDILSLLPERGYFDVISCCYGLYYSRVPAKMLQDFKKLLKPGGRLIIVGPDRGNNSEFYLLLKNFNPLPQEVKVTSRLMRDVVVLECRNVFAHVRYSLFQNAVVFPTPESLLNYWLATNLFKPEIQDALAKAILWHFKTKDSFTTTKRAMGVLAF